MFRKVFKKKRCQGDYVSFNSFESCAGSESPRPRLCGDSQQSPEVAVVENSPQAPILVSDASIEDLSLPVQGSRRVRVQTPERSERGEDSRGIEELYFNEGVGSNASEFGKPNDQPNEDNLSSEVIKTCSCLLPKEQKQAAKSLPLCKIIQESGGASSFNDTECSSWDASARAHYYHHKLMTTLQVLANKEETVRVQTESLRVAEARIAALSARADKLRAQLDGRTPETRSPRDSRKRTADAAVSADAQELEEQKSMVKTLQTNLSVIEDLYRECFYETAKQEELIEMLRRSCLDVRLMERDKGEQIGRLQRLISDQNWSMERCQDMSTEVENLKMEISNFLNSSNNDSGMWERSESPPVDALQDLRHIADQLLRLRGLLTEDCTCGLQGENMKLKDTNETMQIQVGELRQRISELEAALKDKETGELSYRNELGERERELADVKQQLAELQDSTRDRSTCEALAMQLRQAQVSIEDQTRELVEARKRCQLHDATIAQLRDELERTHRAIEESGDLREQVHQFQRLVSEGEERALRLAEQLARAHQHCRSLDECYRDKAACAETLQAQLCSAHSRGAALCAEVKRVVCGVRACVRRMRARQRELENKIKEQDAIIKALQFERNDAGLIELPNDRGCPNCISLRSKCSRLRVSETDSCECGSDDRNRGEYTPEVKDRRDTHIKVSRNEIDCKYSSRIEQVRRKPSASEMGSCGCSSRGERRQELASIRRNETVSCDCSRVEERRGERSKTSGSEVASCSSAPTPPRRLLKKKFNPCDEKSRWRRAARSDASAQQPTRRDAASDPHECAIRHVRVARLPREASPSAELEQRVSALHAALQLSQERWTHATST